MQNPHPHPHPHQLQQHLASLLAAAAGDPPSPSDDPSRAAALASLRRSLLHPSNSPLLPSLSPFLAPPLSVLLADDKSYAVRRAAVAAYAELCAVLCSHPPHPSTGGLPDGFVAWALPLLGDPNAAELVAEGLAELLAAGEAAAVERFVPPLLGTCRDLLEDERTSLAALHRLLGLLTMVAAKFPHCFQPHFVDVVDLLLGWAFVPDLADGDRGMIMDSFLQFQRHWVGNLQFSLGLLAKFLGDMEVLVHDPGLEAGHSSGRLRALFACFSTVLQVMASGVAESSSLRELVTGPIEGLAPPLLRCALVIGTKLGWSEQMREASRCLILLAEILREKFAEFYEMFVAVLVGSLRGASSAQLQAALRTNRQLLSLQNLGLRASAVRALLKFHSPISRLRLHPNHGVAVSSAATYLFCLQHGSEHVVSQAITSMLEELELLKSILEKLHVSYIDFQRLSLESNVEMPSDSDSDLCSGLGYSQHELLLVMKFDLKILLSTVLIDPNKGSSARTVIHERATRLTAFISDKLNPFDNPFHNFLEIQFQIFATLHSLSEVELLHDIATSKACERGFGDAGEQTEQSIEMKISFCDLQRNYIFKYRKFMVNALDGSSSMTMKLEALEWIDSFGRLVLGMKRDVDNIRIFCEAPGDTSIGNGILLSVLNCAHDREPKIRSHVAISLEVLFLARLVNPVNYSVVTQVLLDKLNDPDNSVRTGYLRLISIALPITAYMFGLLEDGASYKFLDTGDVSKHCLYWQHILAVKQQPRKLHWQQLVSILSYISHRTKLPLSSWVQRLVFSYRGKKDTFPPQSDVSSDGDGNETLKGPNVDRAVVDRIYSVNNLAALWWGIHEAARHCINLRLRTHLGGPTQTFAALERMLLDVPNILAPEAKEGEGRYVGPSDLCLLPMRLLLDFVEALKRYVYNAYEGSFVLPAPPKASSLFFGANRRVCEEWFSRICEPMLNAGLALHCSSAVIHYCSLRLLDLKNLSSSLKDRNHVGGATESHHALRDRLEADVLKVLQHASLALCRCHETDALVGLQRWAVSTFHTCFEEDNKLMWGVSDSPKHFSWMTGLIYQAQGQYEKAAAHYSHLLQSEEALSSMGSDGIQYIIARVIECYTSLSDWKCLEVWLAELQALRAVHAGKPYSGALTTAGNELNAVHALACFDDGDFRSAWGYLDLTPKSSCELTLDPKVALERSEQMLLRSMLQSSSSSDSMQEELDKAKSMLDEALSVVPLDGLTEAAAYVGQLHCIFAFEEATSPSFQNGSSQSPLLMDSLLKVMQDPIDTIHQDCSMWLKVFRVYRTVQPSSLVTLLLCQKLVSLARKQRNFLLANRLNNYLINHSLTNSNERHKELLALKVQYEGALLKYDEGKHEEALTDLWSLVRGSMLSTAHDASEVGASLNAKACLKLSTWMEQESSNPILSTFLSNIYEDFSDSDGFKSGTQLLLSVDGGSISPSNYHALLQEMIGRARKVSCHLCPSMGKAWLSYASWCFDHAKYSLSAPGSNAQQKSCSHVLQSELLPDGHHLKDDEMSRVEEIIRTIYYGDKDAQYVDHAVPRRIECYSSEHELLVNSLVEQATHLIESTAGAPGCENRDGECPSALLASQLKVLLCKHDPAIDNIMPFIDKLIEIWWSLRRRRVSLFGHAAQGYFQYLSRSSTELQPSHDPDALKGKTRSYTLRALLYVLHIILNYGVELKETLETGLSTVPLLPWQEITPQLFARLSSHPEKIVRKQLEGLLVKLGRLSPCSLVYPTLVDVNAYEGEPSEELRRILDFLVKLYPKLIEDVRLAIEGLGMITVLWEEQWLSTLQDLHSDALRRINMLKEEAARVTANSTLSLAEKIKINDAKYSAVMAPIIVALERRLASTSREPRTSHEMWFQKEYNAQLKSAVATLKIPPGSAAALGDIWRPFDVIAASLATHQRKSCISLSEIAPQLAALSTSDIPMPGFEKQILDSSEAAIGGTHGIVTISSFCEQVTVLSTKTKPKKLVLQGSDGQKYTYLLKGREDLRLDARVMQLLEAINSFLYTSSNARSKKIAIRYYTVTPISGRAGLIQWVENVSSIYNVYKSWQKRSQMAQLSAVSTGNRSSTVPPIPRPSDMFYGKIIPALKEKGIKRVISRRDWPIDVKRKVLLELMKETPRQILWQEMWCASEGFRNFYLKVKRFSGSIAAMSMVGHVLGLGDRHLDNILMDFSNGDVVHIDYNVCFDKGRRLKIPEIVPFRLTQTIETALGLTGVEGAFRVNCEAVMGVLLKNRDIILMLLEVFVWDPLIEWTRGNSQDEAGIAGEEKKGMELAVSLSLFSSRIQEIRVPLQEHQDLLLDNLPTAESALKSFLDALEQYEVVSAIFYHAEKERSTVVQNETSAKSIVAEATSVAEKSRTSFELQAHELAQAKAAAADKANELAIWVEQHGRVLEALRDNSIPGSQSCMRLNSKDEALSLTSAVLVSGVPLTVVPEPTRAQCYDLDREVSQLITELHDGLSSAVESLGEYALVLQRVLPVNYITTSPVTGWAQVLQLSVNGTSQDMLSLAKRQATELIAKAQGEGTNLVQQRYRDLLNQLESYVACVERLDGECSELMNSIGLDNEVQSKERLLSAFTKSVQLPLHRKDADNISTSQSGQIRHGEVRSSMVQEDLQEKTAKVISILGLAVTQLYGDVRANVSDLSSKVIGIARSRTEDTGIQIDAGRILQVLDEQIEKCVLVSGFMDEFEGVIGTKSSDTNAGYLKSLPGRWASVFQATLRSSTNIIEQMTEVVLPEIVRSFISYNSELMEAFGSLSQIRGSVDTALEKLVEVELERASLVELEQNYFVNVGRITEQQIALEEAATRGRDHLSWEEAEELASQEEACRAQLERLQQTWSQKDMRVSSLKKIEANVMSSLVSSKQHFSSLVNIEQESDRHIGRNKSLLVTLTKPFSDLESIDHMLASCGTFSFDLNGSKFSITDILSSRSSLSEVVWPLASLFRDHAFFVWKVSLLDSVLDLCMHEISSSVEHSFSTDQLYSALKKKLAIHVEKQVCRYLMERIAPALILRLDKEIDDLLQLSQGRSESGQLKGDSASVGRVTMMLEEYCSAHETARAARAAVSLMQRQVNELTEALRKTILEIIQVEWLHDLSSPYMLKPKVLSQNFFSDDKFISVVLNINRRNVLDKIQSSVSLTARTIECLQACERTSISAEGQLERAMGWACAGPNTTGAGSSAKSSGIPPEFHDHLLKRRKLLQTAQEQASDFIKICSSVLEFEASRDGVYFVPEDISSRKCTEKGSAWQQTFLNVLTRLDAAYHSFTCAEQEWKLAKHNMEKAAKGLFSVTNQLSVVSVKAKSALADLQENLVVMHQRACEVSSSLSAFRHVSQDRTALTSECGSLLEEVLAIAEGLHDVYTLGKEAAAVHSSLMVNLSKANKILLPLEASLSADLAVMTEAISKERENNISMSLIHGKALYQSYIIRVREACKDIASLVPPLTQCVKELHSMLTKLGRLSSLHAGNLHKALEGLGESQIMRSQDISLSRSDLLQSASSIEKDNGSSGSREGSTQDLLTNTDSQDEGWISPPEHTYTSSSSSSRGLTQINSSENSEKADTLLYGGTTEEYRDSNGEAETENIEKFQGDGSSSTTSAESDSRKDRQAFTLLNKVTLTDADRMHDTESDLVNEGKLVSAVNTEFFEQVNGQDCSNNDPKTLPDSAARVNRGKNPFALSVLKQVEQKLHGRDIDGTRSLTIPEQVDHLLKQATSIDNLCNMYEGWTPWI